jgi:predicted nuclease of predicted toxin-antitoxin system
MKIFVDENIPSTTVQSLREIGHDVSDIRGTEYEGAADDVLWDMVQQERRLLITTDKGFARYRDESHCGILIVRLRQPNRHRIHHRVMQAVAQFAPEEWLGLLVTMRDVVQSIWRADGVK